MRKIATHGCRVMESDGARERIKQRIEKAKVRTLSLVEQRSVSRPGRRRHAGTTPDRGAGAAAVACLTNLDAMLRIGIRHHIGDRPHHRRGESILIKRPAEKATDAKASLTGRRSAGRTVPPSLRLIQGTGAGYRRRPSDSGRIWRASRYADRIWAAVQTSTTGIARGIEHANSGRDRSGKNRIDTLHIG